MLIEIFMLIAFIGLLIGALGFGMDECSYKWRLRAKPLMNIGILLIIAGTIALFLLGK